MRILILFLSLVISSHLLAEDQSLNNKTPRPDMETAQRSGLYEGEINQSDQRGEQQLMMDESEQDHVQKDRTLSIPKEK